MAEVSAAAAEGRADHGGDFPCWPWSWPSCCGLALALLRLYGVAPLRWLATVYVEVVRGTPLLIQLFLIYYGLPDCGHPAQRLRRRRARARLNYAANEAENYRAGIQAIPRGQMEAALALGMSRWQALRQSSCRRPCASSFRR